MDQRPLGRCDFAESRFCCVTMIWGKQNGGPGAAAVADVKPACGQDLDPVRIAPAFVASRPLLTSGMIGATSMKRLRSYVAAGDVALPKEVLDSIKAIRRIYT